MIFDNLAFNPFFDALVVVEGVRDGVRFSVTATACVIDAGFVDVDSDAVAASDEHTFSVRIKRADWSEADSPRRGDVVRLDGGRVLKVASCDVDGAWFELHAKSKGVE